MKTNFLKWRNALLIVSIAFVGAGCKDDDDDNMPTAKTITQTVIDDPSFTALEAAVVKAGLADALGGGTLTVFAPNDAAFAKLSAPFNNATNITAITDQNQISALRGILQYHVFGGGAVRSSALQPTQTIATLKTSGSPAVADSITVSRTSAGVFVNGSAAQVATPDVGASNGVIHVINSVLTPPTGSITSIVQGDSRFDLLEAAVVKAGLANALSTGRLTVFAPTDEAFLAGLVALGLATSSTTEAQAISAIGNLSGATLTTLGNILRYHVVPTRAFSVDLTAGTVPTLLASSTLTVALSPVRVTGAGNGGTASNVTGADVIATNGVIHVIDRVLLPAQ